MISSKSRGKLNVVDENVIKGGIRFRVLEVLEEEVMWMCCGRDTMQE